MSKDLREIELLVEEDIRYWLRENLSALPMADRYEALLEMNEPVLIRSMKSYLHSYRNKLIDHLVKKLPKRKQEKGFGDGGGITVISATNIGFNQALDQVREILNMERK